MNYIGEAVVVGGVRRTAEISLSNHSDERMRNAKMGQWFVDNPQRGLSNNSICYTEKPDVGAFMKEWLAIYDSRSGERGIFNRQACKKLSPERRDTDHEFGTNPCSEIVLRPNQFCNLSEVVARYNDTKATLMEKIEIATILGTLQASLTNFRYLSSRWKHNTEEEALLGVSLTGIYDCPYLLESTSKQLEELREHAVKTNRIWAKKIGINPSAAVTCIKPSGTVSQLTNSASGIHPRYNDFYIRRVRNDKKDPLSQVLIDVGIPYMTDPYNDSAWVFEFPHKAPKNAITRKEVGPLEQLGLWKKFALAWCEHKPSMTCYVGESQWPEVGAWVWNNFDIMSGVSFLPSADEGHIYEAAPYEDCDKDRYEEYMEVLPKEIDWGKLQENQDNTTGMQELACTGDKCEI
jgi:ribonucleoside-diphosphate reductase alpha chain